MGRLLRAQSIHGGREQAIAQVAAGQHGAFSRAQARAAGLSRDAIAHRVRTGRWQQPAREVFVIAGAPATWRQSLIVACLAWGTGVAASHRSAAALWGLPSGRIDSAEITVPRNRRRTGSPQARVHSGAFARGELRWRDGIRVTAPARTLIDLAAVIGPGAFEETLDEALRRGLAGTAAIRAAVRSAGPRPGIVALRALVAERDGEPLSESVFETRLLRAIIRAGLPRPVRQHEIRDARGRLIARVDLAYPGDRIAIEAEGYRWHSGRTPFERDRRRAMRLAAAGWRVIPVTWIELRDREPDVVAAIAAAVGGGGD